MLKIIENPPYATMQHSLVIESFVEFPPQKRVIKYINDKSIPIIPKSKPINHFYLEFPYIQFTMCVTPPSQSLTITTSENSIFEKTGNARYAVPLALPNITNAGKVCLNMEECFGNLEECISHFWNSIFNLDIASGMEFFIKKNNYPIYLNFLEDWEKNPICFDDYQHLAVEIPFNFEPEKLKDFPPSDEKELIKFYELNHKDRINIIQRTRKILKDNDNPHFSFAKILQHEKYFLIQAINEFFEDQPINPSSSS